MPRAVGVAQDQLARGAYAFEDGLDERAVGAAVRVGFAQPVHALPVLFLQGRLFAPYELAVAAMQQAWKDSSTSRRSNVRPLATAIDTGLGSAGSNARWLTLMPMPAIVRARVGPE